MPFGVSFSKELRSLYLFESAYNKYRANGEQEALPLGILHLIQFLTLGLKKCQLKQNDFATYLDYFRWHYEKLDDLVTRVSRFPFIPDRDKSGLQSVWNQIKGMLRAFQDLTSLDESIREFKQARNNLNRVADKRPVLARHVKMSSRAALMALTQVQFLTEHRCFDTVGHYEAERNDCIVLRDWSVNILAKMKDCDNAQDPQIFNDSMSRADFILVAKRLKEKIDELSTVHENDRALQQMLDDQIKLRFDAFRAYYNKTAIERFVQDAEENLNEIKDTIRTLAARALDQGANIFRSVYQMITNPRETAANISHALSNPSTTWNTFKEWWGSRPWWQSALYVVGGAVLIVGIGAAVGTGIGGAVMLGVGGAVVAGAAVGAAVGAVAGAGITVAAGVNRAGAADRAVAVYRAAHKQAAIVVTERVAERDLAVAEHDEIAARLQSLESDHDANVAARRQQQAEENKQKIQSLVKNPEQLQQHVTAEQTAFNEMRALQDESTRQFDELESTADAQERALQERRAAQQRQFDRAAAPLRVNMPVLNPEDLDFDESEVMAAGAGAMPAASTARPSQSALDAQLFNAALHGDTAEVTAALAAGASINSRHSDPRNNLGGKTALFIAAELGHPDVVRELTEHGADKSIKDNGGWSPRRVATVMGTNGNQNSAACVRLLNY